MDKYIEELLDYLCIPLNLTGYKFLKMAVLLKCYRPDSNITDIYKLIALKHKSTYHRVERSIRYIHQHYKDNIQNYFNFYGKINNSVLVGLIKREVMKLPNSHNLLHCTK